MNLRQLISMALVSTGALDIVARPRAAVGSLNAATANLSAGRRIAPEES